MKVTVKKLISVFLGLLVFVTGSKVMGQEVVDRGRNYCPVHDEIYTTAGEHGSQCSTTRTAPPAEEVVLLYCIRCNTRYPEGSRHTCPKPPPVVVSRPNIRSSAIDSARKYRTSRGRQSSFIDIDILAVQRPQRYGFYRSYGGGYGGYGRNYYNLSGRNYFRSWFGKDHHHRDHHEPRRHRHRDHHRGYGGYGGYGYGSYGW